MSPISPLTSSYQPCPGTGSVIASHSSCELTEVRASKTAERAGAALAAGIGQHGVEHVAVEDVVVAAEPLAGTRPACRDSGARRQVDEVQAVGADRGEGGVGAEMLPEQSLRSRRR